MQSCSLKGCAIFNETKYIFKEYESMLQPIPFSGNLTVDLRPEKMVTNYINDKRIATISSPYYIRIAFNYGETIHGKILITHLVLKQKDGSIILSVKDIEENILEYSPWDKGNFAAFVHEKLDFKYEDIQVQGRAIINLEGKKPFDYTFDILLKTHVREEIRNDFLNNMNSV